MTLLLSAISMALMCAAMSVHAADITGGNDYPGIGRFGGSVMTGYVVKDFDSTTLQAAPFAKGKPTEQRRIEGRITRIAYRTDPGASILEVARNFEDQLGKDGFRPLLTCDAAACGGTAFSRVLDKLPTPAMVVDGFKYRYHAGQKIVNGKSSYATVLVSENNGRVFAQLIVTVAGAMEDKMIDAAAMSKGLGEKGHIPLYGIHFDTNKATIKAESRPTLEEMAKLLSHQPRLNVLIVGHTDNQGGHDHNMALSKERAEAVALALSRDFGVAPARMRAAGVGYLAPVGSNATEEGRALNRRVELVEP